MKKKVVSLCLALAMVFSLAGCDGSQNSKAVNDDALNALNASIEGLRNTKSYVITTDMDLPTNSSSYIEVVRENFNYTEYPVDNEGNIINSSSEEYGNSYMLSDWMTNDTFYTYAQNDQGERGFYILPKSFKDVCADRTVMFANILVNGLEKLEEIEPQTTDMGDGAKEYKMYKGVVSSDAIRKVIEPNGYALYDSLIKDYPDNANVVKYAQFIKDDMDFNMVYGKGNITFAVADGVLRGYTLEIGGLGTRMYITKSVITSEEGVREEPDFSGATDWVETIQSSADYISQFNTYEEALADMYKSANNTEDEDATPTDGELVIDDTEVDDETTSSTTTEATVETTTVVETTVDNTTDEEINE